MKIRIDNNLYLDTDKTFPAQCLHVDKSIPLIKTHKFTGNGLTERQIKADKKELYYFIKCTTNFDQWDLVHSFSNLIELELKNNKHGEEYVLISANELPIDVLFKIRDIERS